MEWRQMIKLKIIRSDGGNESYLHRTTSTVHFASNAIPLALHVSLLA